MWLAGVVEVTGEAAELPANEEAEEADEDEEADEGAITELVEEQLEDARWWFVEAAELAVEAEELVKPSELEGDAT